MSDKIYKESTIPDDYNLVGYDDETFYFFKDGDFSSCYIQKYIQGRYVVDYISNIDTPYNLLATSYEISNDYVYRADANYIFVTYTIIFCFLMFGINIVTRVIHRKGLL